ncbi:MAG: DUF3467 domain-containing protein [Pirellulales bacterium]
MNKATAVAEEKRPTSKPSSGDSVRKDADTISAGATEGPRPRQEIQLDDKGAEACYANFCRVTGTPEELIIDFGLNPQPFGVPADPIPIKQRLIVNFYTAKRLLHALNLTLQRHEATFGVLETNVQKRVTPSNARPLPNGG